MMTRVKVFRCMLIGRGVAAADVAAGEAKTKVQPALPEADAVFATARTRRDLLDLIKM